MRPSFEHRIADPSQRGHHLRGRLADLGRRGVRDEMLDAAHEEPRPRRGVDAIQDRQQGRRRELEQLVARDRPPTAGGTRDRPLRRPGSRRARTPRRDPPVRDPPRVRCDRPGPRRRPRRAATPRDRCRRPRARRRLIPTSPTRARSRRTRPRTRSSAPLAPPRRRATAAPRTHREPHPNAARAPRCGRRRPRRPGEP